MALNKKLKTGTCIRAWNYEESNYVGQAIGVKNSNGDYNPMVYIESVNCLEGTVDRVIIKKSELENMGFAVFIE